jgi:hypothetical protein
MFMSIAWFFGGSLEACHLSALWVGPIVGVMDEVGLIWSDLENGGMSFLLVLLWTVAVDIDTLSFETSLSPLDGGGDVEMTIQLTSLCA